MKIIETHIAPKQEKPIRLSDYAAGVFSAIPSRKGMKKAIDNGLVRVNGEKATTAKYILGGETISLHESRHERKKPVFKHTLEVHFEDEYLAVISKPPGMVVSGNQFRTVENALPFNLTKSSLADGLPRPQPIHRLDFPTSGLLLVGKTRTMVTMLNQLFEQKRVKKTYHAICCGTMHKSGIIDLPIKGKEAITEYKVLQSQDSEKYNQLNLVRLMPETGRRHQIRFHLSSIGHPILGDKEYGEKGKIVLGKGLYLHASGMDFQHPVARKNISVSEELPKKFRKLFPEDSLG